MKNKGICLLLTLMMLLSCVACAAAEPVRTAMRYDDSNYMANKCPVSPAIYSTRRYKDRDKENAYDLNKDFSADAIQRWMGARDYGLYLKFTPGRADNGYQITRFDAAILDPTGEEVFAVGFDDDMKCQYGYYWYWDFFNLDEMFQNLLSSKGYIPTGVYTMHIYFNGMWAGKTQFRVQK